MNLSIFKQRYLFAALPLMATFGEAAFADHHRRTTATSFHGELEYNAETKSILVRSPSFGNSTQSAQLWGLEISDEQQFSDFILDRPFYCIVVETIDEVHIVDCYAGFRETTEKIGYVYTSYFIPLFDWLPELKIADRSCDVLSYFVSADVEFHSSYAYGCPKANFPVKSRTRPE